jgi:hypothetical protein
MAHKTILNELIAYATQFYAALREPLEEAEPQKKVAPEF